VEGGGGRGKRVEAYVSRGKALLNKVSHNSAFPARSQNYIMKIFLNFFYTYSISIKPQPNKTTRHGR